MSCPTCDHTMQNLRDVIFWCPRCGTICDGQDGGMFDRPKLVERCREFAKTFPPGNPPSVSYSAEWRRLGIAEAIHLPEDRP